MIDFKVELLKLHFAFIFVCYKWLNEKHRILGRLWKHTFGVVFILDDFLTNMLLYFKWNEVVGLLVTDRLKHYKATEPGGSIKHKWATELCEFANKYDEGHC